jgi:lipoprotein-releasing system permease protein
MFELNIAFRYLRARKKEGFASVVAVFSFLGIMLGVATLIVVMAVMNGVKLELVNRILGINAHLSITSANSKIENYPQIIEQIKKIDGVKTVNPSVQGQVLASVNGINRGIMVRGLTANDLMKKELVAKSIKPETKNEFDGFTAIIGTSFAKQTGSGKGDIVKLVAPEFTSSFFGSMPRNKDFLVVDVFDVGMFEYDSGTFFVPLNTAQKFFKLQNAVNIIEVEVNNLDNLDKIKSEIRKILPADLFITDWQEANKSFIESIKVQANVLFLILMLIIIVAAFNVISGMVMLVGDKQKEVAILRTIGASRTSIVKIFIICGSLIGVLGTIFGLLLGLGFAANIDEIRLFLESISGANLFSAEIYFLSKLPAQVKYSDVVNITGLALLLSFLATIYPAYKAAKIKPAEALRYE